MYKQITLVSMLLLSLCACSITHTTADTAPQASGSASAPNANSNIAANTNNTAHKVSRSAAPAVAAVQPKAAPQKPIMVEFYSTICAICKQIQPAVNQIQDDYKGRVDFKSYDAAGISDVIRRQYKFIGYPQFVIIDSTGSIAFNRMGYQNYNSLKADLDAVLVQSATISQ